MSGSHREMKFCRSCSRNDWHRRVKLNPIVGSLAIVASLGTAALVWPYRCVCCGHMRPRRLPGETRNTQHA